MSKDLVFIASGGRTGTNFFGELLGTLIEDCHSEHEPDLFLGFNETTLERLRSFGLWHMVAGRALGLTGVRVAGTRLLTGKSNLESVAHSLRRQRARYHARVEQSLIIESYYAWWMVAPVLQEIFPGAKLIGVVRDPRTWIASWQARQKGRDRGHWTHWLPPGPVTATSVGDARWASRWEEIGPIGRLAWQWSAIAEQLVKADTSYARIFRFEDLFGAKGFEAVGQLVQFASHFPDKSYDFEVPPSVIGRKLNASSATSQDWQEWSAQDRALVNEICGPHMERFGYEPL